MYSSSGEDSGDSDKEIICTDQIRSRKIRPQNVVNRLIARELGGFRRPGTDIQVIREFYQNIYPNLTIINVEKPAGYLRKFSPDGKYLITFSYDQKSLEIYRFNGVVAAARLIYGWKCDFVPSLNTDLPHTIRSQIFDKLFTLKHNISVTENNHSLNTKQLNRECSLFTNDNRYVIIGAASFVPEELRPNFYEIYSTNESTTPTLRSPLENYSLYMIDLEDGRVADEIDFLGDKIILSHNQGLYLYNKTLAILSIQHQSIYIYEVFEGRFYLSVKIGRFCVPDEIHLYSQIYPVDTNPPWRESTINSLKHHLLVFLFNMAKRKYDECGDNYALRKFYQLFDQYKDLKIWKLQLIDDDTLLIKYASEEVIMQKAFEPNNLPALFVFYNFTDTKILAVYDNKSEELLSMFENYTDAFRNCYVNSLMYFPCTPNNNIHVNLIHERFKQSIVGARGGGEIEASKRILSQLPISAQSYSNSPYLDLSLFSYDVKWISVMERPKTCGEYPIHFFARDSGLLKFRIYNGYQDQTIQSIFASHNTSGPRLVAFTFHPTEPFAISVQRIHNEYVANFHIRNSQTILQK